MLLVVKIKNKKWGELGEFIKDVEDKYKVRVADKKIELEYDQSKGVDELSEQVCKQIYDQVRNNLKFGGKLILATHCYGSLIATNACRRSTQPRTEANKWCYRLFSRMRHFNISVHGFLWDTPYHGYSYPMSPLLNVPF